MKILLISNINSEKLRYVIISKLLKLDSDINPINTFVCSSDYNTNKDANTYYKYNISYEKVKEAFQNNSVLYCSVGETNKQCTYGVMDDDYLNGDILSISFTDFNNIKQSCFDDNSDDNILVVWVDSEENTKEDIRESRYTLQRIEKNGLDCLWFNTKYDSVDDIANTIISYIKGDEEARKELIEENK